MNKKQTGFRGAKIIIVLLLLAVLGIAGVLIYQHLARSDNVYFLRSDNDKLDLVTASISKPGESSVVVSATGHENSPPPPGVQPNGLQTNNRTIMLARPDWRYVALRSQRDSDYAKLYIFDAKNKTLKLADGSPSIFVFVGWQGGRLVYATSPASGDQYNANTIKSYDPTTGKTITIDSINQTPSNLNSPSSVFESMGPAYIINGKIIHSHTVNDHTTITTVNSDGTDRKQILSLDESSPTNNIYAPRSVYFTFSSGSYVYADGSINKTTFALANKQPYHFYIASPSGKQVAWYERKNGQNQIFIGDQNAQHGKVVGTFPIGVEPYAWSGSTLIVAQNNNILFRLDKGKLVQISAYWQPPKGYNGAMAGYPGASYGYAGIFDY